MPSRKIMSARAMFTCVSVLSFIVSLYWLACIILCVFGLQKVDLWLVIVWSRKHWLLEEMVACTLDYKWHHHVIAALVSLFSGVVVLLPIRFAWQVLERRRRRQRITTATRFRYTLCQLQSSAEGIIAGNSTVNKSIVSSVPPLP